MKIGTKSVLIGAHCFFLHPFFVAWAWTKLYGFPWQPWLWVAFFVHDIGYIGSPNMDGPEGEEHPWVGARFMYELQGAWIFVTRRALRHSWPVRWWEIRRQWNRAQLAVATQSPIWGNEVLFHSRFLCRTYNRKPSRLCAADKIAFVLEPWWMYLPRVRLTGEIREYKTVPKAVEFRWLSQGTTWKDDKAWVLNAKYVRLQQLAAGELCV